MDFPDIPDFLRVTKEEQERRRQYWKGRKLTKVKFDIGRIVKTEDAQTRAFRKMIEKQEAEKKALKFALLRERYGKK